MIKITYDPEADAAIIHLEGPNQAVQIESYVCEDLPEKVKSDIVIDFDQDGILRSIEILHASSVLPKEMLEKAELI